MAVSDCPKTERSSTENERFMFFALALEATRKFLFQKFPHQKFFLEFKSDSLPLRYQSDGKKLTSLAAVEDFEKIFDLLET